MKITQFEIWEVDLSPTQGSEQHGVRPCVILQTNASGENGRTTIIAPLTSKKLDQVYPFEVRVAPSIETHLRVASKLKLDQIRVIDTSRIVQKIGFVPKETVDDIVDAIDIIFDLRGDFR